MKRVIGKIFPFLSWFKNYKVAEFRIDLVAGLTVALVLIPQSMAYAQLAGLPAYYGLYASFLPPMVAALFGSSRQLATGPVAVVSLMTAASLEPLATAGSEAYIAYAIILALTVGVFQLTLGVLRLGLVVNFLSHPVVNGFTNAAAIIIATSQLSKLFGVSVDNAKHHFETIIEVIKAAANYTHWPTLAMGILAFAIMYGLKRINPRIPNVLVAVIVTTLIAWLIKFEKKTEVPAAAIGSEEVAGQIEQYNDALKKSDEFAEQRTELNARLTEVKAKSGAHCLKALEIRHEIETLNFEITELRETAARTRFELRERLFVRAEGDGDLKFFAQSAPPAGTKTDGKVWRLRVGSRGLDPAKLTMFAGGQVVGTVPKGLPQLKIPKLRVADFFTLLPYAVIITLLGFMEAISIAKAMAAKTGQFLDPDQELIGQGLANIFGSFGQSYPVSGSFSRSAVNLQAGAVSGLSSVVTSVTVVIALLLFTPLLYHLPQATLAAVIMMAVVGLVSVSSFVHAWRAHRVDGTISVITFFSTLAFAPHLDKGIMTGVALSLGIFIYNAMRPKVAHLSLHPDCSFRDAEHWGLKECRHIALIRFDGNLFFASASYFETLIMDRIKAMPDLRHVLLVANGINDMDASGEEVLSLAVDNVRSAGIDFSISGLKESVLLLLKRTHLYEKVGEEHIFPTQAAAINVIFKKAHEGSDEDPCPLLTPCPEAPETKEGE